MTYESLRGRIVPPDLDDRTWQELVDQMRALIPSYAPDWTDHNPSDLGITLIELFAWLAESMLYRLNQTPQKNYLTFLNLLGVTRNPPTPAHTYLTFTSAAGRIVVPTGTQAQTAATEGRTPVVFETDEDTTVLPTALKAALAIGPYAPGVTSAQYTNLTATLVGAPAAKYLLQVPAGQVVQLCLGFDKPVSDEVAVGLRFYQPFPAGSGVTTAAACSQATTEPLSWAAVAGMRDGTARLSADGSIRLTLPADWAAQHAAGSAADKPWSTVKPATAADAVPDPLYWIGLRIASPAATASSVGIERLLFNSALARTAVTIPGPEALGQSAGTPFQVFPLANRPLFRRPGLSAPYAHLAVQVGTGTPTVWEDWKLVEDLPPGPGSVYRVDPVTGEIMFGNYDESTTDGRAGHGSIPPRGAQIQAVSYRYVAAGTAGNVAACQVTLLGAARDKTQPGPTAVTNFGPGQDGGDEEPVEDTLQRAPEELKIRDRAVTADDYEFLAGEASTDVRIRRCLPPRLNTDGTPWNYGGIQRAPGAVNVVIVPDQGLSVPRPAPTPDLIRLVRDYLDPRRDLTAHLEVLGPCYLPVHAKVTMQVWLDAVNAGVDLNKLQADTIAAIKIFLHPTQGGPQRTGWAVGQSVFTSDLFQAIAPAADVGYISNLQVKADPDPTQPRPIATPDYGASVWVADYELVCAADITAADVTISPPVAR
jgi:predicted phage baseplate assembly protein